MAKLSAETRFALASAPSVNEAINRLNHHIAGLGVEKFITFLCLVLDSKNGPYRNRQRRTYGTMWRRQNGIEQPGEEQAGVPLGIMEDFEYDLATITLSPGERLVLYTDGINEAPNAEGTLFGIPTIEKLLASASQDVSEIGTKLTETVLKYIEGTTQADDMCLLVIGRG